MEQYDYDYDYDYENYSSWIPGDNGDTDYELEEYLEVGRYEERED